MKAVVAEAAAGECRAKGCSKPATHFMCEAHWKLVPPSLRSALGNVALAASGYDLVIVRGAIEAVAHREARARRPNPVRKPVQLALFDLPS